MTKSAKYASIGFCAAALMVVTIIYSWQIRLSVAIHASDIQSSGFSIASAEHQPAIEQARKIVRPLLDRYPGISVAVGVNDSLAWVEAFGYSDATTRTAASPATRFRAYSLAKPLTATAVLRLSREGRVDLDAPISRYVPQLPPPLGRVTVRQLGGHLSGVRDYKANEWLELSKQACATPAEALGAFINDPLERSPGAAVGYSSFNYVLLSALIESASGERYGSYMQKVVLDPSRMTATMLGNVQASASGVSVFYEPAWMGRVRVARAVDNSCKFGAGDLVTTAEDLVRFGNSLLAGRLLDAEGVAGAFARMKTSTSKETDYAFGWGWNSDAAGERYVGHSGGAIGGRSALLLYPDEKVVVAILANIEDERFGEVTSKIARLFLDHKQP